MYRRVQVLWDSLQRNEIYTMPDDTKSVSALAETALVLPRQLFRLVVLVPGLSGHLGPWAPLRAKLAQEDGYGESEAVWLYFDQLTWVASRGTLDALAVRLRGRIDAEWDKHGGFVDIVLVGHSMGGLVARHAYLLAAGAVPGFSGSKWADHVSRFVLLASINRGVDLAKKPQWNFLLRLSRLIPFLPHFLVMDAVRGSCFLTNLRINWIRHFGMLAAAQEAGECWLDGRVKRPPLVVQLVGEDDDIVSPDDSKDVLAFPSGQFISVPDVNHRKIYRLDLVRDPEGLYSFLRKGFLEDFKDNPPKRSSIKRVIFLLHGIRGSNVATWIKELEQLIKDRQGEHTEVKHPNYGYFTAAQFCLPNVRRKNIAKFQDWYTEALAEYPMAEFNIIAHSNGTYILGQSLRQTPGMRVANVALVGSVLPTSFPWEKLKGQVGRVRNDRANRDWPVALLCNALRGLLMRDIGTAGFAGFEGEETEEVAYYNGDHGEALRPGYQKSLIDFIFGGQLVRPANLVDEPGYYRQLSNTMPYLAVLLVLTIVVGVSFFVFHGGVFYPYRLLWSALGALAVYVLLDII